MACQYFWASASTMAAMPPEFSLILARAETALKRLIFTSRSHNSPRTAVDVVFWAARFPNIKHVRVWIIELGELSSLSMMAPDKWPSTTSRAPSGELVRKESAYTALSTTTRSSTLNCLQGFTLKTTAARVCANSASILHSNTCASTTACAPSGDLLITYSASTAPSAATRLSSLVQNQQKPVRE
ncbi:hypothetical protein DFH09DRAFT_1200275 [Mycena vulgaris]|nr:hypothetical protein DFH09DRAFT_1200275 [Mycena vulgaris]